MAKQPEQIVEEQLVARSKCSRFGVFNLFKSLKINSIKNLTLKMFTEFKKGITFVTTVLATLKFERAAYQGGSFAFIGFFLLINKPPMPLLNFSECTLRGSFLLYKFHL